ncbi:MAG: hypothetical protein GYA21_17640 [Myxococcales bacterium]|nr:hypothetical protein [Myxococcales bacterium]
MADHKRRTERKMLFRVLRYRIQGREYADLSTNISPEGIFIKNTEPPPVGTEVVLTVKLPPQWGNLPLDIVGQVVHVNDGPDLHKRGMGIRFLSVTAQSLPIIEYFVREVFSENPLDQSRLEQTGGADVSYRYQVPTDKKS